MSQPLDQLVYGWSEHGLVGRNRLQLVATSPSWKQDNKYRRVAQRLARLEAAGDRYPISFGWSDVGGRRFVFQRTLVPSPTGDARRLVAHIVSGAPEDLPVDLVLRSYDSRFWWRGEHIDTQVDGARPDDLTDGWSEDLQPAPTMTSDALLQRILAAPQGAPATFEGDWRDTYACLWGIHRSVPGLLESLNCSTYETGQMATWFDVAGLDGRPRPHGAPWCARNASEPRYSASQASDLAALVASSTPAVHAAGPAGRKVLREVLRVGERIVSGHTASVPSMLTSPETLPIVLAADAGVRGVADALWSLDRQQWPAIAMDGVVADQLVSLAVAAADAASPDLDASLTAVARRLQTINPELGAVFVERILVRQADGARLPKPDHGFLAAALNWAYDAALPENVMASLLFWAQSHLTGALVDDRRVPESWRTWLFGLAATRGVLGVKDYAQLIAHHPDLFTGDDWLPPDPDVVEALMSCDSPRLRSATSRAFCAQHDVKTVARTAMSLRSSGRLVGCAALLEALGTGARVEIDTGTVAALWALMADLALASARGEIELGLLELPWSVRRQLGDNGSWAAAAGRHFGAAHLDVGARMRSWPAETGRFSGSDRAAFTQVVLHDVVLQARSAGGFATWVDSLQLDVLERDDTAVVILAALPRRDGIARAILPAFTLALQSAVTRSGFLGLKVSTGRFDAALSRQLQRIRADSDTAFSDARSTFGWAASRWLRRNGAF